LLCHFFAADPLRGVAKGARGFVVVKRSNAARLKPVKQTGHNDGQVGASWARNDTDGVKRRGRLHVVLAILLQRLFSRVQQQLLIACRAEQVTWANAEDFESELDGGGANGADGHLVKRWIGDDASFPDVFRR